MSRIATIKPPSRRSLACIGIPDHRDALAIYFRWVRQRYYRAHAEMGPDLASSVRSTTESNNERGTPMSTLGMQRETARLTVDLLCVGARFEGEAMRYPHEIDVVG